MNSYVWIRIKMSNYMNSYKWIGIKISEKEKKKVGISTRDQYGLQSSSGTPSTSSPPPSVPILFIYRTIRRPSEKADYTIWPLWHIVNPFKNHRAGITAGFTIFPSFVALGPKKTYVECTKYVRRNTPATASSRQPQTTNNRTIHGRS